MTTNMTLSSRH